MADLWIATTNQGKIKEFERLLDGLPLKIRSVSEMSSYSAPPETGKTFLENARIKAKSVRSIKSDSWVLADDSGLEAEGLAGPNGGIPGVHSARYAGPHARDMENYLKLLKMIDMRCPTNRNARFVSVLVAISPTGEEFTFEGILNGSIGKAPKGTTGFGYDPVFIPEGATKTLAEMTMAEKNAISHRSRATQKLIAELQSKLV